MTLIDALPCVVKELATAAIRQLEHREPAFLPHVSGVYFAVNEMIEVCYVGCSVDIHQRWSSHALRKLAAFENWKIYYKEVDYKQFASKEQEEAFYIAILQPAQNKVVRCKIQTLRSNS